MKKLIAITLILLSSTANTEQLDPSREWIAAPWEVRYLLVVSSAKNRMQWSKIAADKNALVEPKVYLLGEALFQHGTQLAVPKEESVCTVHIGFEKNGSVTFSDLAPGPWVARRSIINHLVLLNEQNPLDIPYTIAEWDTELPRGLGFSSALCGDADTFRYSKIWSHKGPAGNFGCREWMAQLQDAKRPYIDVTTYVRGASYIGEFTGWARFTDFPKPVIGKQGKSWLCLYECPAGERPGVIVDIRKWTRKHGYPMPKRPAKQPEYPDADFERRVEEMEDYGCHHGPQDYERDPKAPYSGVFRAVDETTGKPVAGRPYRIEVSDGRVLHGCTDNEGMTQRVRSQVNANMTLDWETEMRCPKLPPCGP